MNPDQIYFNGKAEHDLKMAKRILNNLASLTEEIEIPLERAQKAQNYQLIAWNKIAEFEEFIDILDRPDSKYNDLNSNWEVE